MDVQTCAGPAWFALASPLTLSFDFLTSRSVHAECLPWTISLTTLELIACADFLLEAELTKSPMQLTPHTCH